MKLRIPAIVRITSVLIATLSFLSGCATTGMDRATKTTTSMQTVEVDYQQASQQIDATRASLEDLIKPNQPDMKKSFEAYTGHVEKMEKSGRLLDRHTEQMRTRGNEYFIEWENTYTNPEIRELSERRRIEIRDGYRKISEASIGVRGALKSYLTDIREIQKYLSNDLTPQGIESIKPIAQQAVIDGDNLKETVKPVLTAIDLVKADMTQGGMNKGTPTGGDQK